MRAVKNRRVRSTELLLRARLVRAGVRGWRRDLTGCPQTNGPVGGESAPGVRRCPCGVSSLVETNELALWHT
jgi:hypothetical protein